MQQHRAPVFEQRIRREHALFLVRALARGVILPVEEQIDDRQITQVASAPRVELLIELLRHAAHRALAQPTRAEGLGIQGADVLGRQPADVHATNQGLEIRRPRTQPLDRRGLKSLIGAAELRDREVQHAPPRSARVSAHTHCASQRARDRHGGSAHAPETPWLPLRSRPARCSAPTAARSRPSAPPPAMAPPVPRSSPSISSFNRTLGGTLFMALISSGPATNGAHWFESPGGYQRLFAFTGSLGHHQPLL